MRDAAKGVAELAGLSVNVVAEALLCHAFGLDHPHRESVVRAAKAWRSR